MASPTLAYLELLKENEAHRGAFQGRLLEVAGYLEVDPNWLMITFFLECSMNPKAVNKDTGASGLIQFMPATAKGLGTTVEEIREMPAYKQLDYVQKYLKPIRGRAKRMSDLYLFIFYPKAFYEQWPDRKLFPLAVQKVNPGITDVDSFRQRAIRKAPKYVGEVS